MRITRPPNKPIENYEQYRIAANIGCNKCPYCAAEGIYDVVDGIGNIEYIESQLYLYHKTFRDVINSGKIINRVCHILNKDICVDTYKCKICGAEWTSEPYERR